MGGPTSMLVNGKVKKFTVFIKDRGNPFLVSSVTKIYHFPTGQVVNEEDASQILNITQSCQIKYIYFRKAQFITKEKNFDTIKKKKKKKNVAFI